jgi:hypothetical protein
VARNTACTGPNARLAGGHGDRNTRPSQASRGCVEHHRSCAGSLQDCQREAVEDSPLSALITLMAVGLPVVQTQNAARALNCERDTVVRGWDNLAIGVHDLDRDVRCIVAAGRDPVVIRNQP